MPPLKKLISAFFDKQFLKFCLVGVANTLFGTAIMFLLRNLVPWPALGFSEASQWPYWISSGANYFFGSILSYFLNKYFTFKYKKRDWATIARFTLNIILCYGVAYGVAKPLVRLALTGLSAKALDNVAMLAGMVIFTGLNYLGQRFFAFKTPENDEKTGEDA